eukprot:12608295-Alexandrium_andersonii.AAC.1
MPMRWASSSGRGRRGMWRTSCSSNWSPSGGTGCGCVLNTLNGVMVHPKLWCAAVSAHALGGGGQSELIDEKC